MFLKKEVPVDWNVRYETPAGKAWPRETPQASAEGGPPAESECLEWKSLHIPLFGNRSLSADSLPCLKACISGVTALGKRVSGGNVSHFTMGIVFRVTNALFIHIIFTDMHFLFNFIHPVFSPVIHHFNDRQQGHSKFSHGIFDFRRDLGIYLPMDDAVFH